MRRAGRALGVGVAVCVGLAACAGHGERPPECPRTEPTLAPPAPVSSAPPVPSSGTPSPSPVKPAPRLLAGTWLYSCCDDQTTWLGMIALTQTDETLHGAWLTDGDSHGSYVEGTVNGDAVHFARRWVTNGTPHEQFYELSLSADGSRLDGTFTEPAFDPKPHRIQITRGFSPVPRPTPVSRPPDKPYPVPFPIDAARKARKGPCDCSLVCYCGGVPPGPEHYAESARCGSSCHCRVCPPLP